LVEAKIKLNSASQQIDVLKKQIAEIERSFGDEKQHLDSIQKLKSNLAEVESEIQKFSAHAQIVSLALEFLEKSKPEECPVCSQPIEYQSVVSKLKKDTQILVSENVTRLREKEKEVRKNLRDVEKSLENYKDISTRLASEEANIGTVRQEIESITGKKTDPSFDIDQTIEESRQEISNLTAQIATLSNKCLELDHEYNALKTCLDKLEESQSSIQKAIKSSNVGKELIQNLAEEIERIRDKAKSYEDTKAIDEVEAKIEAIKELVEHLQSKEDLEKLEKELPQVTELVSDLKARIEKLSALEGSVEAMRQIIMAHQRELVTTTLGALEDSINHFYSGILGHPFFAKLRLEPEEDRPFIYSIKGLSSDLTQSTYIPTRFSNTQMNIVALSLFLSNNTKMAGNLALVVMDDPAQSMDREHKEALAKTICDLSMNKQMIIATQDSELKIAADEICKDKLHTYEFTKRGIDGLRVVSD
jgi:DNA repair exonuclease SbcCD ATPase subunit